MFSRSNLDLIDSFPSQSQNL